MKMHQTWRVAATVGILLAASALTSQDERRSVQLPLPGRAETAIAGFTTTTGGFSTGTSFPREPDPSCSYRVRLIDPVPISKIDLMVHDRSPFGGGFEPCFLRIADGRTLQTSRASPGVRANVSALPPTFSGPADLFVCNGEMHHSLVEPVDYTQISTWALAANDHEGNPILPPRVCVADLDCDDADFAYHGVEWKGDPACGDANYDERVTAADALRALSTAVGSATCEPFESVCDADGDGSVAAGDALRILQHVVELPVEFRCPPPCTPGTIGPPTSNGLFDLMFELPRDSGIITEIEAIVDFSDAGGTIVGTSGAPGATDLECRSLLFSNLTPIFFEEAGPGKLRIGWTAGRGLSGARLFLACRFQSDPGVTLDPATLVVTTTAAASSGEPVDPPPTIRIGRIEARSPQ